MKNITSNFMREKYLNFFKEKGHAVLPSASLLPENDPTVLFTTAGMHPLVPYFLGEKHPAGKRVTDVQKCLRTGDIDSVGDASHCTFFEMLGNWSFGDYFKHESIEYSFDFLTNKNNLGLDKDRLYFTVFAGDENAPKDMETYNRWLEMGVDKSHIFFLPKECNWWGPAGTCGPCGPDTEIFYDTLKPKCCEECSPACDCGKYIEIWNNVFMEYNKDENGNFNPLKQKNVDTGMGLERVLMNLNNLNSVYETDLFAPIIKEIEKCTGKVYEGEAQRSFRIIADHIKASVFLLGDDKPTVPSNTEQGYVLRRLIRRAIRHIKKLGCEGGFLSNLVDSVIEIYKDAYPELKERREFIVSELIKEETLFSKTLNQGLKEFQKLICNKTDKKLSGEECFRLYDTFGFPIEFTEEVARENEFKIDLIGFKNCFKEHQEKSRQGSENKFKGGLADHSEETTKLHTATHLLHGVLREKFGSSVEQRGSNITAERLRFDFSFDRKITSDELASIENRINELIDKSLPVKKEVMTYQQAKDLGAIGLFKDKYDIESVNVYSIGDFSIEICGGPHVQNTSELGHFHIVKEEASSSGVRRIKAVLN